MDTIKKLKLDPKQVIITKEKLEKSRKQYAQRSFSLQKPQINFQKPLQFDPKSTKKQRLPSPLQEKTVYGNFMHPTQTLFKGSNIPFSRKLATRDPVIDKENIKNFGSEGLIMPSFRPKLNDLDAPTTVQNEDTLVSFKNQFFEIRQNWAIFTQNIYQSTNLAQSFRFLLDMTKMFRFMRQKLSHADYTTFLTSIISINDLRLLLLSLIQSCITTTSQTINLALTILYLMLDLDPRIPSLHFFQEVLRSFALNFVQKIVQITDDQRVGEIVSLVMWKFVAMNIISFSEALVLVKSRFYGGSQVEEFQKGQIRYNITKQIFQKQSGLILSSIFTCSGIQNLQRYTLNLYSDASQLTNSFLVAFKAPSETKIDQKTKDYARAIAKILHTQGVKSRSVFSRNTSQITSKTLQNDLKNCFNSIDFEQFQERFSLTKTHHSSPILTSPDDSNTVILAIDRPVTQLTFDAYQNAPNYVFCVISAGPQHSYFISEVRINPWQPTDKLPPVQFLAPAIIYRQKAAERASLRQQNSINLIQRVQCSRRETKFEEDLIEALQETRAARQCEKFVVNDFFDLVQDQDLLFGNYLESVHMLQQLEEIGLNIVNFQFPTVSEASAQLYDRMKEDVLVGQNFGNGTLGLLVEQIYSSIQLQEVNKIRGMERSGEGGEEGSGEGEEMGDVESQNEDEGHEPAHVSSQMRE